MCISLMAYIPDQFILRGVEYIMNGNGEFYGTKTCCKVTGIGRDTSIIN
jgi:hypothetical protein